MALRSDLEGINSRSLNGVRSYMDPLADSVDWSSPKIRCDVKKCAHKLLCSFQREHFETAKVNSSSVRALSAWTSTDMTAPYLLRKAFPSSSLMEGT
jgi:site-specific recombinase XerD